LANYSERHSSQETDSIGSMPSILTALPAAESVEAVRALPVILKKVVLTLGGLFVFILALELLRDGAREYGRAAIAFLDVTSATNALGLGWMLAYIFLSGSPVAAISITLFSAQTISPLQTFAMITGSRLGASFIVLLVGFIYYLRGHRRSASISIGVLSLLTTAAIYVPAFGIGSWVIKSGLLGTPSVSANSSLHSFLDAIYDPIMAAVKSFGLPGWSIFLIGVGALLVGFQLLDKALPELNPEQSHFQRIGRLIYRPLAMFVLGMAVTSITMSVAISLSLLVPLSAKGLVRRENTMPYIMGANITTFIDTLVAALIVGGPPAFMIVLLEMATVATLSLIVLLFFYRRFESTTLKVQEWIIRDNRTLVIFLGVMFIVPLALLFS
jgi:sodium-dependent phosphate cotransporter